MRKSTLAACVGMLAASVSAPLLAAEGGQLALGVTAGTLGIGPEVSYRFNDRIGLRANGGFFNQSDTDDLDDIEYDADLKLDSFGAMLDWYPLGGGFRISAGARVNNNKIDLLGTPTTAVEIGNVTYTPAQVGTLTGTITTRSFAPTLTLGYGGKLAQGITLGFEFGLMMQGAPRIDNLQASGALASNQAFLAQLAIEEQQAEADAHKFKLWPILQIGLAWRF
jgi:hypothetical protein